MTFDGYTIRRRQQQAQRSRSTARPPLTRSPAANTSAATAARYHHRSRSGITPDHNGRRRSRRLSCSSRRHRRADRALITVSSDHMDPTEATTHAHLLAPIRLPACSPGSPTTARSASPAVTAAKCWPAPPSRGTRSPKPKRDQDLIAPEDVIFEAKTVDGYILGSTCIEGFGPLAYANNPDRLGFDTIAFCGHDKLDIVANGKPHAVKLLQDLIAYERKEPTPCDSTSTEIHRRHTRPRRLRREARRLHPLHSGTATSPKTTN